MMEWSKKLGMPQVLPNLSGHKVTRKTIKWSQIGVYADTTFS